MREEKEMPEMDIDDSEVNEDELDPLDPEVGDDNGLPDPEGD